MLTKHTNVNGLGVVPGVSKIQINE